MAESGPRCGAWGRCFSLPLTRGVSTFHAVVSVSYLTRRGDLSEPSCAPAIPLSRPEVSSRRRWIHFAFNHQPFVQSISGQEGCRVLQLVCLVASVHVHKAPHGSCSLCGGLNQVDSWREPGVEGVIWLGRSSPALCGRPASAVTPSRFIDILAGVEASLSLLCAGGVCVGVLSELWWVFFLCMLTELSYIYFFSIVWQWRGRVVACCDAPLLWCCRDEYGTVVFQGERQVLVYFLSLCVRSLLQVECPLCGCQCLVLPGVLSPGFLGSLLQSGFVVFLLV